MKLLIIRHADPDYANDSLTQKGFYEAELLSERLLKTGVDYVYCSTMGRAVRTAEPFLKKRGISAEYCDWLREFDYRIHLSDEMPNHLIWDMLPEYWTNIPQMYEADKWYDLPIMKTGNIKDKYLWVCSEFDKMLEKHGYKRNGKIYDAVSPNRDTIALFCHFGLETVLLSHLINVPPMVISHNFAALPSSVTTLYSEERRQGKVSFRCVGFGDLSHLYEANEEPSFSARFCETFDCDERHD